MTHVSVFSGIGGLDLAAEWAGFETVLQVEQNPYALQVLEKHWPDVPRITDIREVYRNERWYRPTVLSGGFPCQPFSQAGKRGGQDDDRYLWPEMLRVIRELSPTYVVAENVSGLLSLNDGAEFELVCSDLEREGYEVLPFHYPAASVGAPHRRDRVFIIAHDTRFRGKGQKSSRGARTSRQRRPCGKEDMQAILESPYRDSTSWPKPLLRRGHDDFSSWVDRLKTIGNAVAPEQAYPIFKVIAELS